MVAASNKLAIAEGIKANDLVKAFCSAIKGGGGGSAAFAQGGGKEDQNVKEGVKAVNTMLEAFKAQ